MDRPTLSSYLRENLDDLASKKEPGPYVTISRQYGCDGYELADMLADRLKEQCKDQQRKEDKVWTVFKKELLKQLAEDTGLTEDIIERERLSKPSLLKDFLRGVRSSNIPDGYEIRNKITIMVRTVAFDGHAIIVGQGGAAATADLSNGISVRLEASKEWRIARVSWREKLTRQAAIARIDEVEKQRRHLRKIYEEQKVREPMFNLMIDNSLFNIGQAVDMILLAMEQKELIQKM